MEIESENIQISSSDSDSGDLLNIGIIEHEQEAYRKVKAEKDAMREKKRVEMSAQYGNCYFSQQTKAEKAEKKIDKIRAKRKRMRQNAKIRRRKYLESLTAEQRQQLADQARIDEVETEKRLKEGLKTGMRICIDCGFEDQMSIKENKSLASQINFTYGRVRSSKFTYNLTLLNYKGIIQQQAEKRGMTRCHLTFEPRSLSEMLDQKAFGETTEVVYLSPDAEEELTEFKRDSVYVIGGLVDATVSLMQTKRKARDLKVITRKLPLEGLREKYSKFRLCLNINTVFYIIDEYFVQNCDMEKAIEACLPDRFKTGRNKRTRRERKLANIAKKKAMLEDQKNTVEDDGSEEGKEKGKEIILENDEKNC